MLIWIKSLRLPVCILAGFLAVTSFTVAGYGVPWDVIVAVFFVTIVTMLQNDWRDRFHDIKKGKTLASKSQHLFLAWLILFWVACAGMITVVATRDINLGALLFALAVVGLVYSETRMIPFVPIALVSLSSAVPAILPLFTGSDSYKLWPLFLATLFISFSREIMGDMSDKNIDVGYKWTLPIVFGERRSKILASVFLWAGIVEVLKVSLFVLPASIFAVGASVALWRGVAPDKACRYLDLAMVLVILTLLTVG